jgi:hypothetical protein
VGLTKIHFNPKNVIALFFLYTLLSFWDLIALTIGLPFLFVNLFLNLILISVFVFSIAVLGTYFIQEVIGYDLGAYTLENLNQVFVTLAALGVSSLVLLWHGGQGEDWLIEKGARLGFNIRQQLQKRVEEIIQQYRRNA